MGWKIGLSREAEKSCDAGLLSRENVLELVRKALKKFKGDDVNLDIKKLKGKWEGFYRMRKGNIRIIAEFDFNTASVLVEVIDDRGALY